ncbi:hypothetical protein AX774_g4925 [Zancudomyces culisetae]|uniref:Ubiquitin-like protease family profile domain-containing protein n=1 Tax=Zancudomyces culisetae TaxID=1213189 RepID=A0A1R1PL60_ZANCU|nr:hypothetical protein AX774_g4925 [Zancudomyces culisetae]|eukprot:OMH81612.1 hypothetical protein AX774_g4925 [Zancudomyces culisetae]
MSSDLLFEYENHEIRRYDFDSLLPRGWLTGEMINFYLTSLLVYSKETRTYYYYDSINKHNKRFAEYAAQILAKFLDCSSYKTKKHYDCGVYVLAIAEELSRRYVKYKNSKNTSVLKNTGSVSPYLSDRGIYCLEIKPGVPDNKPNTVLKFSNFEKPEPVKPEILGHGLLVGNTRPINNTGDDDEPSFFSAKTNLSHKISANAERLFFKRPYLNGPADFEPLNTGYNTEFIPKPVSPVIRGSESNQLYSFMYIFSVLLTVVFIYLEEIPPSKEKAFPRNFWRVIEEDIENPNTMRSRIRRLVIDLKNNTRIH